MTTETSPGKGHVSVRWKWAADSLNAAIAARESYSLHSKDCRTCRFDDAVDRCPKGSVLYPTALQATEHALTAYQRALEVSR